MTRQPPGMCRQRLRLAEAGEVGWNKVGMWEAGQWHLLGSGGALHEPQFPDSSTQAGGHRSTPCPVIWVVASPGNY